MMMGPRTNSELQARREAAVPRAIGSAFQIHAVRAENAEVWDIEGNRYIDFAGGIAVLNTGHRHPEVMRRVQAQAAQFTHSCFQVLPYDGYIALAERLNAIVPVGGPAKTAFFSTGAEAIENALKIARFATGRSAFVSFTGSFHGRTMMALAITGKVAPYKAGFGPMLPDVFHVPFPNSSEGIGIGDSLGSLDRLFKTVIEPRRVAALIVEPVQGEGGFYAAPPEFLKRLRYVCDEHGILLIADEIQTGFARTGKMFALEHANVRADIVTMAKSLGGGFPISAVTGTAKIMDAVGAGGLGSTYAGHPLSCAAALAVLDIIENERLCERAVVLGRRLVEHLRKLRQLNSIGCIADIRALGSMVALEIAYDADAGKPAPALAKAMVAEAARNGLILLLCGPSGNVLRFLYPLTISDRLFDEALRVLGKAIETVAASSEAELR